MMGEKSIPPRVGMCLRKGSITGSVILSKTLKNGLYGSGENQETKTLIKIIYV